MAVKKGILDNFLKPSSHYSDNQKNLRSIFIDKSEDDLKPEPQSFLETTLLKDSSIGTQLEHNKDTSGTQIAPSPILNSSHTSTHKHSIGTQQEHIGNTIGTQIDHNKDTTGTHKEHSPVIRNTTRTQQEHAKEHNTRHNRNTSGTQQEHIKNTNHELSYLTGIQKQLLVFFYSSCKKTRSHITEAFSLINIADTLNIRLGSVKTSLRRLEDKQFISSVRFKKGRGGWTKFELPDAVYREMLENEKEHNWNTIGTQIEHVSDTQRNTEKNTNPSSSSSFLKDLKTTTTEVGAEWNFDITSYARFGFTVTQVKQLASLGVISAADVEQSLIEFSYDMDNNSLPFIKTGKINFLMGLLRAGHLYVSEGFKNEQEAMIAEMAKRASLKRESLLKAKFEAWEAELSDEDRKKITDQLPPALMTLERTYGVNNKEIKNWYFDYYMRNFAANAKR
jgi:hypothetical protein